MKPKIKKSGNCRIWFFFAVCLCFLISTGIAKAGDFEIVSTKKVQAQQTAQQALDAIFFEFQLFQIDVGGLNQIVRSGQPNITLNFGKETWQLSLHEFEIRTEDYVTTINGVVQPGRTSCPTFRGHDNSHPERRMFALISPEYVAFTAKSEEDEFYVEPLNIMLKDWSLPNDWFVFYKRSDLKPSEGACGNSLSENVENFVDPYFEQEEPESMLSTQQCILVARVETNTDQSAFFNNFGANATTSNNYMLNIVNLVSDIYWNYPRIQLTVSAQNNYSDIHISWCIGTGQVDASTLLNSYGNWMNTNRPYSTFPRTTSILFSGRDFTNSQGNGIIGLAGNPHLCSGSASNINEIRSTNAQQTILIAHEVGHNFDGRHCDGNNCGPTPDCDTQQGTIMCGVCCNNTPVFSTAATNRIRSYAESRVNTAGCFLPYTRTLTSSESPCYLGNCSGVTTLNFIYHIVQTSGTVIIGNSHTGLYWNGGERVLLKPGFKAAPNAANRPFRVAIVPCNVFPSRQGVPWEEISLDNIAAQESGGAEASTFRVYPNPFSSITNVELNLPTDQPVEILVFDVLGKLVSVIQEKRELGSGLSKWQWDARDLPGRLFFLHIKMGDTLKTAKVLKM